VSRTQGAAQASLCIGPLLPTSASARCADEIVCLDLRSNGKAIQLFDNLGFQPGTDEFMALFEFA
jgi:hypothetical protein